MKGIVLAFGLLSALFASAEIQIIDGVKYECKDGMCMPIFDDDAPTASDQQPASFEVEALVVADSVRIAQGYMDADRFVAFLKGAETSDVAFAEKGLWLILVLVLLGGVAMNLTPCVLPMVPINLMVIGKSAMRGVWYGAGIAVAYGVLGVLAAVGGMAFGEIQGNPWFNAVVATVFVILALALFDVFFIDLSKFRKVDGAAEKRAKAPLAFAFSMGALSAVLAGACVAPILISVLLLTADLFAKGNWYALGLPFLMGVGMALPWPFVGAGLKVLPKPGAWMKKVNFAFGVVVLCFAAWYGYLSFKAFAADGLPSPESSANSATPATFAEALAAAKRPVLVDCWASWCKNCAAMERGTLRDPKVVETMEELGMTVIKLQAEDMRELKTLKGFEEIMGLPAFVVFE